MYYVRLYGFLVIFSLLLLACNERIIVSDTDSLGLKYRVKTLEESFYFAHNSFNKIVLNKKLYHYKYKFNNNCKFENIEKEYFYKNSRKSCDTAFIETDSTVLDSLNNSFPFVFKEPEYYKLNYNYISDSLTILKFYNKQDELEQSTKKKYKDWKLYLEERYTNSDELISKQRYWYNTKNQLINKTIFYRNNYYEIRYIYSWGKKLEADSEFNYEYLFDINGRLINKKKYNGISFISEICYYYNNNGDIIMEQELFKDGDLKKTSYNYIYDTKNNWIVCIEYNATGNIFVKKREITYYS